MYTLEAGVIRSHAVELQARNGLHALFGHILLGEDNGQFLGTVVTVVEEDYNITFLDGTVEATVHNRLDEFIRNAFVVGLLHSLDHIRSNLAFTVYQQIVGNLHTLPTFVTVHGIETSHDGSNLAGRLLAMGSQLLNEAFTALRVGITTVHKTVDEGILDTVFLGNIAEFEQMVKELCTPPLLVSPIKWIFLPFSFAYEKAETISLFFRMLPSAQARLIFTKSW